MAGLVDPPLDLDGLRIAHLIECDGPGGAERVVAHLATHLQAAGASNVVLLPVGGEGWLASELADTGVAVEYFHLDQPFSPACADSIAAVFRRRRISIAHSHEFAMSVYGSWGSWLAGVQHVITMHGSRYYSGRLRRRLAMRAAMALSGQTVAVSNSLADQMRRDLAVARRRLTVVANGVRSITPGAPVLRAELGLSPSDRVLVSVGNLYPVKGHRYLIEALGLLANRHPSLHLAICGRGDLEDSLRAQATQLGLAQRVHLVGLRSDLAGVLGSADIFVHPSVSEALPLALLEAMFSARPIVASRVGEIGSALDEGNAGVLVEPANAGALAGAIDRLLVDGDLAASLAEAAHRRAYEQYDISRMAERYLGIYAALLRSQGHRHPTPSKAPVACAP